MATGFASFNQSGGSLLGPQTVAGAQAASQQQGFQLQGMDTNQAGDAFDASFSGGMGGTSTELIVEGAKGLFGRAEEQAKARTIEFNAEQIRNKGKQSAINALAQLNDIQASNIVAAYGSGIQLSGSVTAAQEAVGRKAAFVNTITNANVRIRAGAMEREAKRIRAEAEYQQIVGGFKIVAGALIKYYSGGTV